AKKYTTPCYVGSRAVEESDVGSLVYLQGVVKEVLRLHPPGPLLSWARLATVDTTIDGHHVPAGTTAMVNMGSDLRLAPFGSGRRACPGKNLGMTTASFWVATILHEFEVVAAAAVPPVDLSEVLKLSCEMATPLAVELRPRRLGK
ncbi:Cytochrome P450 78A9, partial [Linum perenne]